MKSLKLLFLVTEDWYFVSHRLSLAIAAREAGFDVVVATRVNRHAQQILDAGLTLIPLGLSRRLGNPIVEILKLICLYRDQSPDIVHHVALKPVLFGTIAARLAGVPRIVNAIAGLGWIFISSGWKATFFRPLVQWIFGWLLSCNACCNIVQNSDDEKLLAMSGVPTNLLHLIRGAGVNTDIFCPKEEGTGPTTVILPARMLWSKGVGEFVQAAELLHREGIVARFVLVGEPDEGNPGSVSYNFLTSNNGNNSVEWWGHSDDMSGILAKAHIACLPSYREGLPKSLLESASCGLAIVTTDTPGCREVVIDGYNGFLVPVMDVFALAQALKKLILNIKLRRHMGAMGRLLVLSEFADDIVISKTLAIYLNE